MHRVAVAYSGGRDSTALVRATLSAAAPLGVEVLALHVHHGLSDHADAWLAHVQAQCERWAARGFPVRLAVERLRGKPARGESIEAWARRERYRALRALAEAQGVSLVLLAHHRRDQAETFMLQALRASGVAGLSGMPRLIERNGITWARPWLDVPRERLEAYVRRHRLAHVEDDSNEDIRFARNRLRVRVWPGLHEAFPQAESALAGAAAWAQEATACLDELAAMDLAATASPRGLSIRAWGALTAPRRSNALRAWLRLQLGRPAPRSLVARLMLEVPGRGSASWLVEGGHLRRYRGWLIFTPVARTTDTDPPREQRLSLRAAGVHALPGWGGALEVSATATGGVPLAWLAHLDLKPRQGGERFQAGVGRPPRSLKKQYQCAAVPAWEREGPLVYSGGQLVFVPGLGIDARVMALPGQPQVSLHWRRLDQGGDEAAG